MDCHVFVNVLQVLEGVFIMKKFRLLMQFLRGSGVTYIFAIISVLFMTVFASLSPLVIKFTVDSVLGGEPVCLPLGINGFIEMIGGVEFIRRNLWAIFVMIVGISLFQGTFMFLKGKLAAVTAQTSSKRMRDRLYNHLMRLPYDYHVKAQTGDIIQRCTSDIETIQHFVEKQSVEAIQVIFQVILVLCIMITIDLKYTLISVILLPIVFIITVRFFINMMKAFLQADEAEGAMTAALQENLTGVRVVKAFGAQKFEIEKFDEKNSRHRQLNMKINDLMADFWAGTDFICMLQHALVIIFGTYWAVYDRITIGTIIAFSIYAGMMVWPLRGLGQMMGFMGQAFVSLGRISEILESKPEDYKSGIGDTPVRGEIVFDNVYFEYEKGKPVLDGASFRIEKGSTVAILGATGSGKSSLVHLLLRLYDYQGGHIFIDGVELSTISREWIRKNIGIVLQEPFLFSKTIYENIALGDDTKDDKSIYEAARIASIHDSIEEFENGYKTIVGERGVTLSGGQRQRIAIARTVVKDVPILIFDDSLSAVDTETDSHIRRALRERSRDTTTIIISHRITTLAEADKILVLDKGKIVEEGSHEELISRDGIYRKIWEIQSSLGEDIA